jgi:hypothetical protein
MPLLGTLPTPAEGYVCTAEGVTGVATGPHETRLLLHRRNSYSRPQLKIYWQRQSMRQPYGYDTWTFSLRCTHNTVPLYNSNFIALCSGLIVTAFLIGPQITPWANDKLGAKLCKKFIIIIISISIIIIITVLCL